MSICQGCGHKLDDFMSVTDTDDVKPEEGAFSVCVFCGKIGVFNKNLDIIPATDSQITWLKMNHANAYRILLCAVTIVKTRIEQN